MNNKDIRNTIKKSNVYYWQVADVLNITDGNFSRLLRKEMSEEQKEKVFAAIEKAKEEFLQHEEIN